MHKKIALFIVLLFFIILYSCIPNKNYYYENGITKPKKSNFDLAKSPYPYHLKEKDWIDTNSIYVTQYYLKSKDSTQKIVEQSYLRFFKNGRVSSRFKTIKNGELNSINYNDFDYGPIGYYKIDETNKITYEFFLVYEIGKYVKKYGYIKKDRIFLFKHAYKKYDFPKPNADNCQIYTRKKVTNLTHIPDW